MQTHYQTLGVKNDASKEEVKRAYFLMAKKYHPDSGSDDEVKKFHEVASAYKVLSDEDTRKVYDATLAISVVNESKSEIKQSAAFSDSGQNTKKRESYRDEELKEFHKNRLRKAIYRVVVFSFLFGLMGIILVLILSGILFLGFLAGVFIGIGFSLQQNFSLDSFFDSKKKQQRLKYFLYGLIGLGFLYFVFLLLF